MIQFLYFGTGYYTLSNTLTGWSGISFNTFCAGGVELTGGLNSFGGTSNSSKTFTFPEHTKISITIYFYAVDSWDSEQFQFFIDYEMKLDEVVILNDAKQVQVCATTYWTDHIIEYKSGWIDHTAPTIKFLVKVFLDQGLDDEALGWNTKIEYFANECFYFYSLINYLGSEYKFCRLQPKENQQEILDEILSFKIPPNSQLILQGDNLNGGVLTTYTTNQPNLGQPFKFPKYMVIP